VNFSGTTITAKLLTRRQPVMITCPQCKGEGWWKEDRGDVTHRCPTCNTRGEVRTGEVADQPLAEWDDSTVWGDD